MQKIEATSPEAQSADLIADNIAKLRKLFPELLTETGNGAAVNVDVLKALVGDKTATDAEEKYGLNWHGKRAARQLALAPSTGTLRPCLSESVDWDSTQNLMIEGDNLEVLKLLQKSYAGKVKLIYIDPPYNTGNDFVYSDDFKESIRNYLELTGQLEDGARIRSNAESSGRFHTDWLNMMLPRLKLARNLLRQDGLVFISINDKELNNLHALCQEVFGEENFIATLVWERGRKNDAKRFSVGHEYIVGYARDLGQIEELVPPWREPKEGVDTIIEEYLRLKSLHGENFNEVSAGLIEFYKALPDDHLAKKYSRSRFVDSRGIWRDNNISWPGGGGPRYDLIHPKTGLPCKIPDDGWRFVEETMKDKVRAGYVEFREDHTKPPMLKSYLYIENPTQSLGEDTEGDKLQVMGSVFYRHSQPSNDVVKDIFGDKVFNNPKDHQILARLFRYCAGPADIICDFFAGSGSSGHAVWELNNLDGGRRRFILVQLPEPLDARNSDQKAAIQLCDSINRPRSISEITKERLVRVGKKFREGNLAANVDLGFRVFKLDHSNIKTWSAEGGDVQSSLLANIEHIHDDRSYEDVLYELLLKFGLDLCVPIHRRDISGKIVHSIGGGVLMTCLDTKIATSEAEALALGIAQWRDELNPAGDTTCVFRDSAFQDDVAKSNLAAILEQHGIGTVRSL
jgi:adenine-specific DNA-methyltransferase